MALKNYEELLPLPLWEGVGGGVSATLAPRLRAMPTLSPHKGGREDYCSYHRPRKCGITASDTHWNCSSINACGVVIGVLRLTCSIPG